jgi:hypothetical protein
LQPQYQGPEPETVVASPALQRLVEGAESIEIPLDDPQTPLTGTAPVEHEAVVPVFNPAQLHVQGPEPETVEEFPAVQRLAVGIDGKLAPFDDPQTPLTIIFAEQLAVVPLYWPTQLHVQGPEPETVEATPAVQRLAVGIDGKLAPLEDPQAPFTADILPVAQLAEDPPLIPAQLHVQGPEPETLEELPALQRLAVGIEERLAPLEDPQAPLVKTTEPVVIESVEQS